MWQAIELVSEMVDVMADTVTGIDDVRELFDVCETVLSTVKTGEVVLIDSIDVSTKYKAKETLRPYHGSVTCISFFLTSV